MDRGAGRLLQGCTELGITLTEKQVEQFSSYLVFLQQKSQELNLTAIHETEEIVTKHFLDSLAIIPTLLGKEESTLLDVGTGAGFPGMPLKIFFPSLKLTLLDSLQKRIHFLEELAALLALSEIDFLHGRAEECGQKKAYREQFDLVVSRAVAELKVLAEYCLPFVKVGGCFLAWKGPALEGEMEQAKKAISLLGGRIKEVSHFKLPLREDQRTLVMVEKIIPTPEKYPRRPGIPQKKPLL